MFLEIIHFYNKISKKKGLVVVRIRSGNKLLSLI